eukprot:gene952-7916_t
MATITTTTKRKEADCVDCRMQSSATPRIGSVEKRTATIRDRVGEQEEAESDEAGSGKEVGRRKKEDIGRPRPPGQTHTDTDTRSAGGEQRHHVHEQTPSRAENNRR